MNLKKIYHEHPSFRHAEAFSTLCEPLKALEIVHFSHVSLYKNRQFSFISQNPEFLQHYLENAYFNSDVHCILPSASEHYLIRDLQAVSGKTKALQMAFNEHGFGHSFTIMRTENGIVHAYNFATRLGNSSINNQYLAKLDFLKQFIFYFHDKIESHYDLKQAQTFTLALKKNGTGFQQEIATAQSSLCLPSPNRVYIPGTDIYITLREYQCLCWLAKGKTQQQIADILSLSLRTVKSHIGEVRRKLNCENQFQLGLLFARLAPLFQSLNPF